MKSNKLNILVAYPYMSKSVINIINDNKNDIRFLLDSGAFTAWKSGNPIKLDDYCKFIESLPFKPWRYFTLDEIGDPEKSFLNYQIMLKRGFNPVPIFTRGEDLSMIDEYYKTSDVLGIGGLVGTKGNKGFVKGVMNHIGDRKVHWLGFCNKDFILHYKPYMCDSSSWEGGARFGTFCLFKEPFSWDTCKRTDFNKKPSKEILKCIASYNLDPKEFAKEKNWRGGRSLNRIINAHSVVRENLAYENKIGTYKFSACTTNLALELLINGYKKEKGI